MIDRRFVLVLMISTLGAMLTGCIPIGDPQGPGARGFVLLGEGVSTTGFKTLRIRAIPASAEPFDADNPQFTGPELAPEDRWSTVDKDLGNLTFPHSYEVGAGVGTTDQERWRLFVWLSADDVEVDSDAPRSGEPYGTTAFGIGACGSGFGGYCTVTGGVNIVIDREAP